MTSRCIRPAAEKDFDQIINLAQQVAEEPDAFLFDETYTREELESQWLPEPSQQAETFVLEVPGFDGIAGVYVLHPAAHGRGSHIAHGLYMVAPAARRRGHGKALCEHSIQEARKRGYRGMRINMVVATNVAAQRVCAACGFRLLCTLPRAFQHPARGLVDTFLMFHDLGCGEAAASRDLPVKPALQYPAVGAIFTGDEVSIRPLAPERPGGAHFEVEPCLPQGLRLDPASGCITGHPVEPMEQKYVIKATSTTALLLKVEDPPECDHVSMSINEDFATLLETVTQIEHMLPEPAKIRGSYGDWMIWMVHRAWLDDPALVDLNFSNMHMPPPHMEPRIAPKLVVAMARNTHMENLTLSNSNLQKASGVELAQSLRVNRTLKTVNLECNWLDSNAVRELALAIKDNPGCNIEHLRFSHQKQMGQFFGRPTEEAVGQMMNSNEGIVKLGFECDDAHWRNIIDRALLRNNDFWRKRQAGPDPEALPTPEERPLGRVLLLAPPAEESAKEVLAKYSELCDYLDNNLKMPTTSQLQNCSKNSGRQQLAYAVAAPMIKELRAWMLDRAVGQEITVFDIFGTPANGVLRKWSAEHDHWSVDIWVEEGKRCTFRSSRDPAISVSEAWVQWLRPHAARQIGLPESQAGA